MDATGFSPRSNRAQQRSDARDPRGGVSKWTLVSAAIVSVSTVILLVLPVVTAYPPSSVSSHCSTLTADDPAVPRSNSFISFDCTTVARTGLVQTPAFTTPSPIHAVVPHFSLSHTGFSDLYVYPVVRGAYVTPTAIVSSCHAIAHTVLLHPGTSLTLARATSYDYCAEYPATASIPLGSFAITWT